MPDETNLVKAGAEGVAKGVTDSFLEPVKQLSGEFCAEVGTAGGYLGKLIRLKTWLWTMQRAKKMLNDAGMQTENIPPKLFLPIMENASLEDDGTLQERWAALLANSANSHTDVHIAFVDMLRQLSPGEAQLADNIYQYVKNAIVNENLPRISTSAPHIELDGVLASEGTLHQLSERELPPALDNLCRLQIIQTYGDIGLGKISFGADTPPVPLDLNYRMTVFGYRFVRACRPPQEHD